MIVTFRQNLALPMAALLATLGASALAFQRWYLMPLLLVPLTVAWWGFRSGVDASEDGLVIRGLAGSRPVPWADVSGFRVQRRRVFVALMRGTELPLPAVTTADIPRLLAARPAAD